MSPESEHGHGHHGTGIRWLDLIVGTSAIFISVVSLVVSIGHGKTMEKLVEQNAKLVAASATPYLTVSASQIDPATSKPLLRLIVRNGGVGPAVIDWFEVKYKGVAYGDGASLLRACCASALPKQGGLKGVTYSNVSQSILPSREVTELIAINVDAGPELYKAGDDARRELSLRACYCSVLDECWQTDFGTERPRPVKECKHPSGTQLW